MSNKELIQALKDNEKPFGLMTEEMQKEISNRQDNSDIEYYTETGKWKPINEHGIPAIMDAIYRLRPDYTEDAGVIECEVKAHLGCLWYFNLDGNPVARISTATSYPDFVGFGYINGDCHTVLRCYMNKKTSELFQGLIAGDKLEDYEVLTPIAVLFKGGE